MRGDVVGFGLMSRSSLSCSYCLKHVSCEPLVYIAHLDTFDMCDIHIESF